MPSLIFRRRNTIAELGVGLLIFILFYTALSKLLTVPEFERKMMAQVLALNCLSIEFLPVAELVIAALILCRRTRKAGLLCSLLLMVVFKLYLNYVMLFADRVPCSCGGFISQLSWAQHLGLNLF